MDRHALTDQEWELIAGVMPERARTGRPRKDDRLMLEGILWILRAGAPWRDLPEERFGPWETVYTRFVRWRRVGVLDRILDRLLGHLDKNGQLDRELWCIDGSVIRASRAAAGAERGGASGGARGSRVGSLTRWIRHKDPPRVRRSRQPARNRDHAGSAS